MNKALQIALTNVEVILREWQERTLTMRDAELFWRQSLPKLCDETRKELNKDVPEIPVGAVVRANGTTSLANDNQIVEGQHYIVTDKYINHLVLHSDRSKHAPGWSPRLFTVVFNK
jgi:hypothetical protein